MSKDENKHLVLRFCHYLSERKLDDMFELMSEDSTWSGVGQPKTFKYGGRRTKAQSIPFIGGFLRGFESFRFDVHSATAEDDRVAIEATSHGVGPRGAVYENQYILVFVCRDGFIVRISEFFDQLAVLEYEDSVAQ